MELINNIVDGLQLITTGICYGIGGAIGLALVCTTTKWAPVNIFLSLSKDIAGPNEPPIRNLKK